MKETAIKDFQGQLKLTRRKLALMSTVLNIDENEMTVRAFMDLLENLQYRRDAIRLFLEEYAK